jgi:hypothetical protein
MLALRATAACGAVLISVLMVPGCMCDPLGNPPGSGHFEAMRYWMRDARILRGRIFIPPYGGEEDSTKIDVTDPEVLHEMWRGLVRESCYSRYSGYNPRKEFVRGAYAYWGDGTILELKLDFTHPRLEGEEFLLVTAHGSRFSFDEEFAVDSFQSPTLAAALIRVLGDDPRFRNTVKWMKRLTARDPDAPMDEDSWYREMESGGDPGEPGDAKGG